MAEPLLTVRDLSVEYRTPREAKRTVRGIDFDVGVGEIVGLTGLSGSGKSTAIQAVLGLVRPPGYVTGGTVHFDGLDLFALDAARLRQVRGRHLSLIVQNPRGALHPMISVGDQIRDVVRAHLNVSRSEARGLVVDMLRHVGINDPSRRYHSYPHEMSGGMAQRVLIAMALICSPKLVIADEPTSGLDVTIEVQILDDLLSAVQDRAASALIVTQSLGIVANYCDRVLVMDAGEIVETAAVGKFFSHPSHPASQALLSFSVAPQEGSGAEPSRKART